MRNSPPVTQSDKGQLWTHSSLWRSPRKISRSPPALDYHNGTVGQHWHKRHSANSKTPAIAPDNVSKSGLWPLDALAQAQPSGLRSSWFLDPESWMTLNGVSALG